LACGGVCSGILEHGPQALSRHRDRAIAVDLRRAEHPHLFDPDGKSALALREERFVVGGEQRLVKLPSALDPIEESIAPRGLRIGPLREPDLDRAFIGRLELDAERGRAGAAERAERKEAPAPRPAQEYAILADGDPLRQEQRETDEGVEPDGAQDRDAGKML